MSGKRQSKANAKKPQGQAATASGPADGLGWVAVTVIALLAALRPLMSETYTSGLHGISMAMGGTDGATDLTPAATAWIDLVIWAVAVLVTLRLAIEKRRWRWTGLELGGVLVLIGAIVSTITTGDKRTALNASADWLSAIVLVMIVAQVVRSRMAEQLLLAAIVASGAASAAKCVMFVTIEHDEMLQEYNAQKEQIWTSQGIALDDPQVELFERRMLAAEAGGFLPFSNAQGSLLVLCGFASLALGQRRPKERWQRVVPWLIAAALWSAVLLTDSRGAMLSLLVGIALWVALRPMAPKIVQHWRKAWAFFWIATVAVTLLVVLYGSWRSGLPTDSLRFRWNYWQVSSEIIADHLWTGTGAHNFDRAYMKRKPIEFPEEVDDPHNFVVSILAQWGVFGLAGLVMMMLGGSWVVVRGLHERAPREKSPAGADRGHATLSPAGPRVWILIIALGFLVLRGSIVASTGGAAAGALVFLDLGLYGVLWCVVFAVLSLIASEPTGNSSHRSLLLELTLAIGVLAFLIHNTIGFSLFIPATLTPWAVMLGLLLAGTGLEDRPCASRVGRWIPPLVTTAGVVASLLLLVIPVIRANHLLTRARRTPMPQAADLYVRAAAADSLDATAWAELAERAAQRSADAEEPLEYLTKALQRDPGRVTLHRQLAQVHYYRYGLLDDADRKLSELRKAVAAAEEVLRRYPASPDDHAQLGVMTAELGIYTHDRDTLETGVDHLQRALDLDADRGEGEIRRKPESWRAEIQTRIEELQGKLATSESHPPSSSD